MDDEAPSVVIENVLTAVLPSRCGASITALTDHVLAHPTIQPHSDRRRGALSESVRDAIAREVGSIAELALVAIPIAHAGRGSH